MSPWLLILPATLILILGIYALHRLFLRLERKGWIYYRHHNPTPGVRGAMSVFQQVVEPEIRHVIEAQDQSRAEIDRRDPSRE